MQDFYPTQQRGLKSTGQMQLSCVLQLFKWTVNMNNANELFFYIKYVQKL